MQWLWPTTNWREWRISFVDCIKQNLLYTVHSLKKCCRNMLTVTVKIVWNYWLGKHVARQIFGSLNGPLLTLILPRQTAKFQGSLASHQLRIWRWPYAPSYRQKLVALAYYVMIRKPLHCLLRYVNRNQIRDFYLWWNKR